MLNCNAAKHLKTKVDQRVIEPMGLFSRTALHTWSVGKYFNV